jgi:hypothetical protein
VGKHQRLFVRWEPLGINEENRRGEKEIDKIGKRKMKNEK